MIKKELRKKYREIRASVVGASLKNAEITRRFTESDIFRQYGTIFLYYPSGSEASTVEIAEKALGLGKRVAFTRCIDRNGNMEFRFVSSLSDLSVGMFGLMEPDISKTVTAIPDDDTLIVVPALAFDKQGYRLGYGGGYYDRYLSRYKCHSAGLSFSECICDSLPVTTYDVKINCIFSDNNIYFFNTAKEE